MQRGLKVQNFVATRVVHVEADARPAERAALVAVRGAKAQPACTVGEQLDLLLVAHRTDGVLGFASISTGPFSTLCHLRAPTSSDMSLLLRWLTHNVARCDLCAQVDRLVLAVDARHGWCAGSSAPSTGRLRRKTSSGRKANAAPTAPSEDTVRSVDDRIPQRRAWPNSDHQRTQTVACDQPSCDHMLWWSRTESSFCEYELGKRQITLNVRSDCTHSGDGFEDPC